MPTPIRGSLDAKKLDIAIVVSRFNDDVTSRLLSGAMAALAEMNAETRRVKVFSVPGAVEIALVASRIVKWDSIDAVIALGAVIRGETSHYDYVCSMVADGCMRAAIDSGVPIAFGVLTCDTEEQALARAGDGPSNKGYEAACVAVEMANLIRDEL